MINQASLARSQQLIRQIKQIIEHTADQRIPFARFMELALFSSHLGYYTAHENTIGPSGDFMTAPEISAGFSRCLAHYCATILSTWPPHTAQIIEVGAGTGRMAADLLIELERLNCLPKRYQIIEISEPLSAQQRIYLKKRIPHLVDRIQHFTQLPSQPIEGILLANEVMDVLPVHCFELSQGHLTERYVTWHHSHFAWTSAPPSSLALEHRLQQIQVDYLSEVEGYRSEVCLSLDEWLSSLSAVLNKGCMILIDYGTSEKEYYHPKNSEGTLRCYFKHRSYSDPLQRIGLQDITTHVNFTQVAHAALNIGLQIEAFLSQASFLLATGLLDCKELWYSNEQYLRTKGQIHQLMAPSEMGELCKVMVLSRDMKSFQCSLKAYDRRISL